MSAQKCTWRYQWLLPDACAGATSYTITNLEQSVLGAFTPSWFEDLNPMVMEATFPNASLTLEDHRVSETAVTELPALAEGGFGTERLSLCLHEPRPLLLRR